MPYGWTPSKNEANIAKHGVSFEVVEAGFDWTFALVEADIREGYGEVRLVAYGAIGPRLHALVFTIRKNTTWIISLRKASKKEVRHYAAS